MTLTLSTQIHARVMLYVLWMLPGLNSFLNFALMTAAQKTVGASFSARTHNRLNKERAHYVGAAASCNVRMDYSTRIRLLCR